MDLLTIDEMLEHFDRDHATVDINAEVVQAARSLIAKGKVTYDPTERRRGPDGVTVGVLHAVPRWWS